MTPFHLLTWCASHTCQFLDACVFFGDSLVPLYNTLVSCNINIEARNILLTMKKLMKNQMDTLVIGYVRVVDKSAAVVTMLFMASRETAKNINNAKTLSAETFLDPLSFNQNGNILAKLTDIHNATLFRHCKHNQNKTKVGMLQGIKDSLADIKQKTLRNIEENIVVHCVEQSFYASFWILN